MSNGLREFQGRNGRTWPAQAAGRVALLEVDPDLAGSSRRQPGPPPSVPVFRFAGGPLPPAPTRDGGFDLGFLVLKGLLIYEAVVCGRAAGELLGPGDVVRPGGQYASGTIPTRAVWTVLEPSLLADLGAIEPVSAKAHVAEAIATRYAERAERIAIERSIGSHVRVDVRVLAYLWHLADRFGVVVPGGVKLELPLTHALLARLVGARRPTVTTALQRLMQLGYLQRDGRTYRLTGDAGAIEDLDRRSPARDFAYPDGNADGYATAAL